jgi:hypothetical protein
VAAKEADRLRADVERTIAGQEQDGKRRFDLADPTAFGDLLNRLPPDPGLPADEGAVRAALAAVARAGKYLRPVPEALAAEALAALREPRHQGDAAPGGAPARAPEFLVALLLGWRRDPGQEAVPPPPGLVSGARLVLWRFVYRRVASCLEHLAQTNRRGGVPGFPTQDPREWANPVLDLFLAAGDGCQCWRDGARGRTPDRLRGNARRKADCCLRQHRLRAWSPGRRTSSGAVETLWYFAERAVKGFVGPFRHEGFPTGMLRAALRNHGLHLARANVVRRQCPLCGWTVRLACEHGRYEPARDRLVSRNWLIRLAADGQPDGGFVREHFLGCPEGHLYPEPLGACPVSDCPRAGAPPQRQRRRTCYWMP